MPCHRHIVGWSLLVFGVDNSLQGHAMGTARVSSSTTSQHLADPSLRRLHGCQPALDTCSWQFGSLTEVGAHLQVAHMLHMSSCRAG
jgi:hypothetical protein